MPRRAVRIFSSLVFLSGGPALGEESNAKVFTSAFELGGGAAGSALIERTAHAATVAISGYKVVSDVTDPSKSFSDFGKDAYEFGSDVLSPKRSAMFTVGKKVLEWAGEGYRPEAAPQPGGVHKDCVSAMQPDGSRRIGGGDDVQYTPCPAEPYQRPSGDLNSPLGRPCLDENGASVSCSDGSYVASKDRAPQAQVPDFSGFFRGGGAGPAWMSIQP